MLSVTSQTVYTRVDMTIKQPSKKRILSGIKPTGDVHLGSYLGAMKGWLQYQSTANEVFFFIADLHALNARLTPAILRSNTLDLAAWLLAIGIDPVKNPIFVQSHIAEHSELAWILNNYTTMGELSRMTQYKDKAQKGSAEGQLVGLFDYPVLMAADILLYDAGEVPVGEDQTQHVELTRDIATRFNNLYGELLRLPKFTNPSVAARVMMLDNPSRKMSKSESGEGCLYLLDDEATIRRKLQRSVTDSLNHIAYNRADQPGVANIVEIISALEDQSVESVIQSLSGRGYGQLKQRAADTLVGTLIPLQEKFRQLRADEPSLLATLEQGSQYAQPIAHSKLALIRKTIGLL